MWGYATGPDRQRLRVLVRRIALPRTAQGIEVPETFRFTIAGDVTEMEGDVCGVQPHSVLVVCCLQLSG
jgi:hypothetical protein